MSSQLFPYAYGAEGRQTVVDASGYLVVNASTPSGGYVLGYGDTGRALCVDASGRLILSSLSPGLGGGGSTIVAGSGIQTKTSGSSVTINQKQLISRGFHTLVAASSMAIDVGQYNNYYLALGATNITITALNNPVDGEKLLFILKQSSGGSKNVTFPSSTVKWRGGVAPTLTATANSIDAVTMIYNSTLGYFCADIAQNFA